MIFCPHSLLIYISNYTNVKTRPKTYNVCTHFSHLQIERRITTLLSVFQCRQPPWPSVGPYSVSFGCCGALAGIEVKCHVSMRGDGRLVGVTNLRAKECNTI